LSILKFAQATNFRVTREEARIIETMVARSSEPVDLRSAASLRRLYEQFLQDRSHETWAGELSEFLQWVADTPGDQRATPEFQHRLWDRNRVSSVGQGNVPVDRAVADPDFRQWLAEASLRPMPPNRTEARAALEPFHEELLGRLKPFTPRVPHLKVFRVLTA